MRAARKPGHATTGGRATWSASERRHIAGLSTPAKVQQWLTALPYNWERNGPTARTLRGVLQHGTAHCLEAALASAAILEQHGHPPLLAYLDSSDRLGHVLHLVQEGGRWGAVARSRCAGLNGRKPVFASIDALIRSYHAPYVDETGRVTGHAVVDLRTLNGSSWRSDRRNVWHIEQALIHAPITGQGMSDAEFRTWKARFDTWWREHGEPHHAP